MIRTAEELGLADPDLKDNYKKSNFDYKKYFRKADGGMIEYANGGGVGSMMQPKRGLVNGPGGYAGEVVPHFSESLGEAGTRVFDAMTRGGHQDQTKIDQLTLLGYYGNTPISTSTSTPISTPLPNLSSGGGGGGGITNIPTGNTSIPTSNTVFEQNLINQGIGTQLKPGSPVSSQYEGMPQTQQQMDNFNAIPVNREYGKPMDIGYGEGKVDPQLAAAVGGKDNTPLGNSNLVTTSSGDVFAADDPMLQEKIDFKTPQQTGAINNVFNNDKNLGAAGINSATDFSDSVINKLKDLQSFGIEIGGKTIDMGKSLTGAALSSLTGIPGLGLALNALPERDPRQNALDDLYNVENGKIQSGLMKDYNPVSGNPFNPTFGLQDAYQKRIDTIEETLARKSDADKNYDPTELTNRRNQLITDKAKEQGILGITTGGPTYEGTGSIGSGGVGVEGKNEGRFSDTPTETFTGVNSLANIEDIGVGEFDTSPETEEQLEDISFDPGGYGDQSRGEGEFDTTSTTANTTNDAVSSYVPLSNYGKANAATLDGVPLKDEAYSGLQNLKNKIGNDPFNINMDQITDLENKYTNKYGITNTAGGKASDARHMVAMNNLSNNIAGPINNISPSLGTFVGDLGAFGAGLIQEVPAALTRGFNKENYGEIGEDIIANFKGSFGTPNKTTSEQIYKNVFDGSSPAITTATATAPTYGTAAAADKTKQDIYRDPIMDMVNQNPLANPNINKGGLDDILSNINLESPDTTSGGLASITSEAAREEAAAQAAQAAREEADAAAREEAVAQETANRNAAREAAAADAAAREEAVAQETANRNAAREAAAAEVAAREEAVAQETANRNAAREAAAAEVAAATARENARSRTGSDDGPAPSAPTSSQSSSSYEDQSYSAPAPVSTPTGISSAFNSYSAAPRSVGGGGGGGGGSPGCFIKGTLITMADGTTKPVEQVDLGDEVAVGGSVFAVGRFLNTELYDYKGIKVSGSHMVNEDGVWIRIRDTKHGISLGDDENIVYVFGSENRRILINNILFTDYFETKEQDKLLDNEEDFFKNWKSHSKTVSDENVDALNAV